MKWKRGITREVILIGKIAIKIPSLRGWSLFLRGLLANLQEKQFSQLGGRFCPVKFYLPGGFLNIMPRCKPIDCLTGEMLEFCSEYSCVEAKMCSFGILKDKWVVVDYGS